MPFITKRRAEKREANTDEEPAPIQKREALNTSSKNPLPKKFLPLKRRDRDASGEVYEGGYIRGGGKESVRTIGGGETRGGEISAPLPDVLQSLTQKAHIAFRRKTEREASKPKPAPKIDRLWFSIVIEHFPRAVPPLWDTKHRSLAKHLTSRIGAEDVVDFVKWCVENWTAVIQNYFSWMKQSPPPPTPSFPFIVKFVHKFTEAKEQAKDAPLEVTSLVKGLNLAKSKVERRESNTPPIPTTKPILRKLDLSPNVSPLPRLPDWRD